MSPVVYRKWQFWMLAMQFTKFCWLTQNLEISVVTLSKKITPLLLWLFSSTVPRLLSQEEYQLPLLTGGGCNYSKIKPTIDRSHRRQKSNNAPWLCAARTLQHSHAELYPRAGSLVLTEARSLEWAGTGRRPDVPHTSLLISSETFWQQALAQIIFLLGIF